MPWAAAAGAAVAGGSQLLGAGKASGAAKDAANVQKMQYLMTRQDLSPFMAAGTSALPGLSALANAGPTGGGPSKRSGRRPWRCGEAPGSDRLDRPWQRAS